MKIKLKVGGMSCAVCAGKIESSLQKTEGVNKASVNISTRAAFIDFDEIVVTRESLENIILSLGYSIEKGKELDKKAINWSKIRLIIAVVVTFPLFFNMIFMFSRGAAEALPVLASVLGNGYLQWVLATIVQFFIGYIFYRNSFYALKAKSPTMDVLIVIGTSAAYFYSVYLLLMGHGMHLYFESSAVVITLVLLGKYLEDNAKEKTSEAVKKLLSLKGADALVVKESGLEVLVRVEDLKIGDIVLIKAGAKIPVDGEIISGSSEIDESMLTGESMPITKKEKSKVIGGTVNGHGVFKFRVEKIGEDTVLSQIVRLVEEAQGRKAPIQKIADQVASVFVPIVLLIALVTFGIWFLVLGSLELGIMASISVLVIACPCSLGLATPTAIMVGTGRAAERGLIFKGGEIIQSLGDVNMILFDKTGTITKGSPEITEIISLKEGVTKDNILFYASILEKNSEHLLGRTIYKAGQEALGLIKDGEDFQVLPGKGAINTFENKEYFIGNLKYLEEQSIDFKDQAIKSKLENQGKTVVVLVEDNTPIGLIALGDPVKEEAKKVIEELKNMGLTVGMITGDNKKTAEAIGSTVGITKIYSEVLPEDKKNIVEAAKNEGYKVAMVGDGINDSPALAEANVGIAMGNGTDIAIEAADLVLMTGDLSRIPEGILISKATLAKIKQNLFWAFFYNVVGIPIAAIGLLSPIIAGMAMAFSSVTVVTNSLSLKKKKL